MPTTPATGASGLSYSSSAGSAGAMKMRGRGWPALCDHHTHCQLGGLHLNRFPQSHAIACADQLRTQAGGKHKDAHAGLCLMLSGPTEKPDEAQDSRDLGFNSLDSCSMPVGYKKHLLAR